MSRFYVYKCVVDGGGAPCVEGGLLSLCICKPDIRSTARVGDVIFAFGSNSEEPANRLVFIAKVTRKLTEGKYYELGEFRDRGDCIYERTSTERFSVRSDARFHGTNEALIHDLGLPPDYLHANSLISGDFRYFGANGTAEWKSLAPGLALLVEALRQGHRVNHRQPLRDELISLKNWVWRAHHRKVLGRPLHARGRSALFDDEQPKRTKCRPRPCYHGRTTC